MTRDMPAVILAAGASRRMGGPLKQVMDWQGVPFLSAVLTTLRAAGLTDLTVVLGCRADEVRAACDLSAVRVVENPAWEQGMLSSLQAGIAALPAAAAGALVTLVDLPALQPATVRAVVAAWSEHPDRIIVPRRNGRGGHPVIFPADLFPEILQGDWPDGPRGLRRAHAARELPVPVDDPGCLLDIDDPEDYRRVLHSGGADSPAD